MITVDTSALIAVLRGERTAPKLLATLNSAEEVQLSAGTLLEAGIVADAGGAGAELDELLAELGATVRPVTGEQARRARIAYRRFGRGSGAPSRLNYGDCFAYALATESGTQLLFTGEDFTHTMSKR